MEEQKEEKNWASGIIKIINPERSAGIIKQIDGEDVLFAFSDMESAVNLDIGQEVLYSLEKDLRLGLKAKNITPLSIISKA
jgi:cold shock CspA family protein